MSSSLPQNNMHNKRNRRPLYPRTWGGGNVAYVGTFRAFSMAVLGRSSLEIGDKIILPQQALQSINRLRLPFPLIFQVRKYNKNNNNNYNGNKNKNKQILNQYKRRIENIYRSTNPLKINKIDGWLRKYKDNPHDLYVKICKNYGILPKSKIISKSNNNNNNNNGNNKGINIKQKSFGKQYCSVYEFSSPQQDSAYLPHWMMQNLGIDEGDKIELQSQFNISKGNYCKLQPFKQEFMDKVSTIGYKSTLEHSLRHYSVLSINQRIVVEFNHFPYQCIIKELKPSNVISILGSTDLEIEFLLPPLNDIVNHQQPVLDENDIDSDDNNNNINNSDDSSISNDQTINKSDIDGALLKQLGVPLDYNEQTNLATMIIENRKLQQENENRFKDEEEEDSDNDSDNDSDDNSDNEQEQKEEQTQKQTQTQSIIIGPDDVQCNNCDKYIHKMSIQMHEVHCIRENVKCKICNKCIKKQNENQHFENYHKEINCICNQICIGKIFYDKHKLKECKLRLVSCKYCDKTNISIKDIKQHKMKCKQEIIICETCNKSYKLKNKFNHNCGIICVLCGQRINDSKDKLLHLITSCPERRAICNYCGIFRSCNDMEQHRKYCGSRSEKCDKCLQYVSLMNMEPHLQSNCQWFNNNQLSVKNNNNNNNNNNNDVQTKLQSLDLNNPYIDQQVLDNNDNNNNNDNNDNSLFGLLKSNPKPTLIDIDTRSTSINKQLCPHCNDDIFMDQEEFEIHIALKHPKLVDTSMTQTIMASFNNPDILTTTKNENKNKKKKKKRRRKLSSDLIGSSILNKTKEIRQRSNSDCSSNNNKWQCTLCTFVNSNIKKRCIMCQSLRPN